MPSATNPWTDPHRRRGRRLIPGLNSPHHGGHPTLRGARTPDVITSTVKKGEADSKIDGEWQAAAPGRASAEPVGCVNCDTACELRVRMSLGYRPPALTPASEAALRAAQTRLLDPVPLHPAARTARPRGCRQGP